MIFLLIQAIENDSDKNRILTLYTKHYSLMKLKALRILHESQIADDMVQDALVSVIKKIDALRDLSDAQLLSYTVKAVQSQSIDYYRKHIRKGTNVPLEDLEDLYSSDDELIDEVIDTIYKKDLSIKLGIILRKLPERDRMII